MLLGEFEHELNGDIARLIHGLEIRTTCGAVLDDAQRPTALEHGVGFAEEVVDVIVGDPIVNVAECQHVIGFGLGAKPPVFLVEIEKLNGSPG